MGRMVLTVWECQLKKYKCEQTPEELYAQIMIEQNLLNFVLILSILFFVSSFNAIIAFEKYIFQMIDKRLIYFLNYNIYR